MACIWRQNNIYLYCFDISKIFSDFMFKCHKVFSIFASIIQFHAGGAQCAAAAKNDRVNFSSHQSSIFRNVNIFRWQFVLFVLAPIFYFHGKIRDPRGWKARVDTKRTNDITMYGYIQAHFTFNEGDGTTCHEKHTRIIYCLQHL